ncbi:hypothetical protein [Streptomyces sp. NPDC001070]
MNHRAGPPQAVKAPVRTRLTRSRWAWVAAGKCRASATRSGVATAPDRTRTATGGATTRAAAHSGTAGRTKGSRSAVPPATSSPGASTRQNTCVVAGDTGLEVGEQEEEEEVRRRHVGAQRPRLVREVHQGPHRLREGAPGGALAVGRLTDGLGARAGLRAGGLVCLAAGLAALAVRARRGPARLDVPREDEAVRYGTSSCQ